MTYMTPWPNADYENERYRSCWRCGTPWTRIELEFESGSVEPTVGETLTGAISADTGIVVETELVSGAWAGGDAAGYVLLSDGTGVVDGAAFTAAETVNGSTGGTNMLTASIAGIEKKFGILYAEPDLVQEDGKWYCRTHWAMIFPQKARDEAEITIEEENKSDR